MLIPMLTIFNYHRDPFSIQCFMCTEGHGGCGWWEGEEDVDVAAGRVVVGLAREAFRFLLVFCMTYC